MYVCTEITKNTNICFAFQLDVWQHPSHVGNPVDIRVVRAAYPSVAKLLNANGIVFTILIPDVQSVVDDERRQIEIGERSGRAGYDYGQYHEIHEVCSIMFDRAN